MRLLSLHMNPYIFTYILPVTYFKIVKFVKLNVPVSCSTFWLLSQILFVGGSSSFVLVTTDEDFLFPLVPCKLSDAICFCRIVGHRSACSCSQQTTNWKLNLETMQQTTWMMPNPLWNRNEYWSVGNFLATKTNKKSKTGCASISLKLSLLVKEK